MKTDIQIIEAHNTFASDRNEILTGGDTIEVMKRRQAEIKALEKALHRAKNRTQAEDLAYELETARREYRALNDLI